MQTIELAEVKPKIISREESRRISQTKIVAAARRLFVEVGYEATTVQQIAAAAGLGKGTVFHYITEKRDLVYMIFNEQTEERTERAFAALQPWQSFREKILSLAEPHYQMLSLEPTLGRILLNELQEKSPGPHFARHLEMRNRSMHNIEFLVTEAKNLGEIQSSKTSHVLAQTIFFCYSASIRWWINSEDISWRAGLNNFAQTLDVILEGFKCRSV